MTDEPLSPAADAFMAAFRDNDDPGMLATVKVMSDDDVGLIPRVLRRQVTAWRARLKAEGKLDE